MRKRKNPVEEKDEDSGSEMEVEGEEKDGNDELAENEDSEDEKADMSDGQGINENDFLDSFYSLSSADGKERSKAAQTILQHCLISSSSNAKDAAYTLRRLLNGICSGRAAARQGNASALSAFLKLAFHLKKIGDIRDEIKEGKEVESLSDLAYIHRRLIKATDPNQTTGKKKGSEERDYQFGRLFGILSIVRSNVLVSLSGEDGYQNSEEVALALASDLSELFWTKNWMREPAAHAITTLLRSFFDETESQAHEIAQRVVKNIIVPNILMRSSDGDEGESDHMTLIGSFCAEQLGVALFIQSQTASSSKTMPFPLNQSVLSDTTIDLCAQALSETSVVVQPRMHFVWDTLLEFLTCPMKDPGTKFLSREIRVLSETCPRGSMSSRRTLEAIIREVVMTRLLRLDKDTLPGKATNERRALALSIIKTLAGVPYASNSGVSRQVMVGGEILEMVVFCPEIVRSLFLDTICAGNEKKKTSHTLKPLALDVLGQISKLCAADGLNESDGRRLALARALSNAEIRFDARTKTSTISDVLGLTGSIPEGRVKESLECWNVYAEDLIGTLLQECASAADTGAPSSRATGYVELLYGFVKSSLRLESANSDDADKIEQFKKRVGERILDFFMTLAFFDCNDLNDQTAKTPKKKGKAKKMKGVSNPILDDAQKMKPVGGISYPVRNVTADRFFALLADYTGFVAHTKPTNTEEKFEKDAVTLDALVKVIDKWRMLEAAGAKRYVPSRDTDSADPDKVLVELQKMVQDATDGSSKSQDLDIVGSRRRCCIGIAVLGYSLFIHRLSCGEDDQESDDPDADDDNDEEEICNALEVLRDVAESFSQGSLEESNPLLDLTEICANLLSSPIGSGNMGRAASPKLIREAVKYAWLGGLRISSNLSSKESSLLDSAVMSVLLDSAGACASKEDEIEEAGIDSEGEEESDVGSSEASSAEDDGHVFAKAADIIDDEEVENSAEINEGGESDVEIDPAKLQTMLEEDSDADAEEDILEHHEGADAALAKLIKLKQETRKNSKQAREKLEISHQLRCTFLLELLFGRTDSWSRLFRCEVLIEALVPILKYRKLLEKSIQKTLETGTKMADGNKQALLDRLTSIFNQKICKVKVAGLPLASPLPPGVTTECASEIIGEAKRAETKEQLASCSNSLVFLIRCTSDPIPLGSLIEDGIKDWSTNRSSKLESSFFASLVEQLPEFSAQSMLMPLISASQAARSTFLKSECFHLLASLFSSGQPTLKVPTEFLSSVAASLQNEDMRKAKRVRIVLKALEKCLPHLADSVSTNELLETLDVIEKELKTLAQGDSPGVASICNKLLNSLDVSRVNLGTVKTVGDVSEKPPGKSSEPATSKSAKKKKKKKKR